MISLQDEETWSRADGSDFNAAKAAENVAAGKILRMRYSGYLGILSIYMKMPGNTIRKREVSAGLERLSDLSYRLLGCKKTDSVENVSDSSSDAQFSDGSNLRFSWEDGVFCYEAKGEEEYRAGRGQ